jgi:hypothetical protein
MKILKHPLVIFGVGMLLSVSSYYVITDVKATDQNKQSVNFSRYELHLTKEDGEKSIAKIINEQSREMIPNRTVKQIRFSIDALSNPLIFPAAQGEQHPDWQFAIREGGDVMFDVPNVNSKILLENSLVKTPNVCNFTVQIIF